MEVAATLVAKAKSVTVVGMEKTPFERVLGVEVGSALQKVRVSTTHSPRAWSSLLHSTDVCSPPPASRVEGCQVPPVQDNQGVQGPGFGTRVRALALHWRRVKTQLSAHVHRR
jgi:hypothetical protein